MCPVCVFTESGGLRGRREYLILCSKRSKISTRNKNYNNRTYGAEAGVGVASLDLLPGRGTGVLRSSGAGEARVSGSTDARVLFCIVFRIIHHFWGEVRIGIIKLNMHPK